MIAKRSRRASALIELVATDFGKSPGPIMQSVVDAVYEDLGAEVAWFRAEYGVNGYVFEETATSGHERMRLLFEQAEKVIARAPVQYGYFDPLRVEPAQQNRIFDRRKARAAFEEAPAYGVTEVYEPLGLTRIPHMRAALTEGPFLLAWLGAWRKEPFTEDEERALAAVLGPIARRLAKERLFWAGNPRPFDLFLATLDALDAPVLVIDSRARLVLTNTLGRELLDRDASLLAVCVDAVQTDQPSPRVRSVTPVAAQGLGIHHVVVVSEPKHAVQARLDRTRDDFQLTVAETRVLTHLVQGTANKDIATRLGCATRTVEVHATSVMRKCKVDSRARLVAMFWSR